MKHRLGKFGAVFLALALALSLTGAGFAAWTDNLTINGTVNTGTVEVGIYDLEVMDTGADPQHLPGSNTEVKDVATHESLNDGTYVCTKVIGEDSYNLVDSVTETITNAYPYYETGAALLLGNCGSIPVKVSDIDLTVTGGNEALLLYMTYDPAESWFIEYDVNGNEVDTFTVSGTWEDVEAALHAYQLEPCHTLAAWIAFYFEEEVSGTLMPQGDSVTFTITVTATQWNEVP